MIVRNYTPGEKLAENEYLLKLRQDEAYDGATNTWYPAKHKTGFLTKLTQKGELPKAFESWGGKRYGETGHNEPIYVFEESPRSGWEIIAWRFGQSQNWATMKHPEGFTVEVYLQQLLTIIKMHTVDAGVLIGKFRWQDHRLIKEE